MDSLAAEWLLRTLQEIQEFLDEPRNLFQRVFFPNGNINIAIGMLAVAMDYIGTRDSRVLQKHSLQQQIVSRLQGISKSCSRLPKSQRDQIKLVVDEGILAFGAEPIT